MSRLLNPFNWIKRLGYILTFAIILLIQSQFAGAATVVTGVPQGSSGKYNILVATPFVMRFDVGIDSGSFEFSSFQIGISANNNSDPLTMTLQSTTGLNETQQINHGDPGIGSGNSAPNALLSFATGPFTLNPGTYSLTFSVITDSEWTVTEGFTSFSLNSGYVEPGNEGTGAPGITISNFEDASDGSVNPVPEPQSIAILAGFGLIAFGLCRKAYRLPKTA